MRLARLAKEAGVSRFLFSSSCSNYGAAGDGLVDETAELHPITPYAISKVRVEQDVARLADDSLQPRRSCATPPPTASRRGSGSTSCSTTWSAWAYTTGRVHIKSDGTPWRPIVHIEDIARAFLAVLAAPRERVHNQAFNVGLTDENYRIRELAEIVRETVPGSRDRVRGGRRPGSTLLPRRLRQDHALLPELQAAVERAPRGGRSSTPPTGGSG